jgi:molybdopterin synthase sulfur carrier subunit
MRGPLRIKIKFFSFFRDLFQTEEKDVDMERETNVQDLLNLLCDSSKKRNRVFEGRELKPYLAILKNGKHIHSLNGLETKLEDGDLIAIFPPAGGG